VPVSKKGPPQTTTSATNTSTVIPDWLSNAAQGAVQTATDLSQRPYTPYTGQQVADVPADTNAAYQAVRNMQGVGDPAYAASQGAYTGLLGSAAPITADAANARTNTLYGQFAQGVAAPTAGLLGNYIGAAAPATAGQVGTNAMSLMNPYTQSVIDPTLAAGEQARQIARQQIAGNAANAGAFGGSRQGVAEGVADAQTALGTQQQIGNMLTSGYNAALTPAYNLASLGSQQGLTAATGLGNLLNTGFGNAQQLAGNMGAQNLTAGLAAAQNLPTVATAQQAADQKNAAMMQAIGGAQQAQSQNLLNANMGDFYAQQNWPVQNLDLLTSTLGGVPYNTSGTGFTDTQAQTTKNLAGSLLGGAAQGASIGSMFGPVGGGIGAGIGGLLGAIG
jgi:hypothetical protein